MKYFSYLNTAATIIDLYKGQQPFHLFIKDFFRQHKKYGSSDRKQITHLCYCFFRMGNSLGHLANAEKILTAFFLCTQEYTPLLAQVKPAWNDQVKLSLIEKCALTGTAFPAESIFPQPDEISDGIDAGRFSLSHLLQPDVFIRARPGYLPTIITKLQQAQINYSVPEQNCISLPGATKIETLVAINKEAVIQDYSSQQTGKLLQLVTPASLPITTWDCCAASGGKSILAKDVLKDISLTVSDIRESVLVNLKKRFEAAGLRHYKMIQANLTDRVQLTNGPFELIIADVPCTGSGTWGRTPERLSFFKEEEIDRYTQLQQKIIQNIMPHLQHNGWLLYITCSVYKRENEDMVNFIRQVFPVELVKQEYIKGYALKADTMFAALLRKRIS